jgi:hypothetical protein
MAITKTAARKSVPLHASDLQELQRVRLHGSDQAVALHELTGVELGERSSESEALHAIIEAGLKAIADKALQIAYARAVEFDRTDPERQQWKKAMRTRRLRPFMSEADAA